MSCPWNGAQCGCGDTFVRDAHDPHRQFCWQPDQDGKMPPECDKRTPLTMVSAYLREVSADKRAEYDRWVKAGRPQLSEWYSEHADDKQSAT